MIPFAHFPRVQHLVFFLVAFILLAGCAGESGGEEMPEQAPFHLEIEKIITLKFPDSIPVPSGKVKMVRDQIWVLDYYRTSTVYVFDREGNYLRQFGGVGEGPEKWSMNTAAIVPLEQGRTGMIGATVTDLVEVDRNFKIVNRTAFTDKNGRDLLEAEHLKIANWPFLALYIPKAGKIVFPLESAIHSEFSDDYYARPTVGIFNRDGKMETACGRFDQIYPDNKYITYLKDYPSLAFYPQNGHILFGQQAPHQFQVYTLQGKPVGEFGRKGEHIRNDQLSPLREEEVGKWLNTYRMQAYSYFSLAVDSVSNRLYRTYIPDLAASEADTLSTGYYFRKGYLQIYNAGYQYLGEAELPQETAFDILGSADGRLFFKNKYNPFNEDAPIRVYQIRIIDGEKSSSVGEDDPARTEKKTQMTGSLEFETDHLDLGTIEFGQISLYYLFRNTGKADVTISKIEKDCYCTDVKFPKKPIPPGSQDTIFVSFDPSYSGIHSRYLTVYSNASPRINRLSFNASVKEDDGS